MAQQTLMVDTLVDDMMMIATTSGTNRDIDAMIADELDDQRFYDDMADLEYMLDEPIESVAFSNPSSFNLLSKKDVVDTDEDEDDDDVYYDGSIIEVEKIENREVDEGDIDNTEAIELIEAGEATPDIQFSAPTVDLLDLGGVEDYVNLPTQPDDGSNRRVRSLPVKLLPASQRDCTMGAKSESEKGEVANISPSPPSRSSSWGATSSPNTFSCPSQEQKEDTKPTLKKALSSCSSKNSSSSSSAISELRASLELVWSGEMFGEHRQLDDADETPEKHHRGHPTVDDRSMDGAGNPISAASSDAGSVSIDSMEVVVPRYGPGYQLESILGGRTHLDDEEDEPELLPPAFEISFESIWSEGPQDGSGISSTEAAMEMPYYCNGSKYNLGGTKQLEDVESSTDSPTGSVSTEERTPPEYNEIRKSSSHRRWSAKSMSRSRSFGSTKSPTDSPRKDKVTSAISNIHRSVSKSMDALGGVSNIVLVRIATASTEEPSVQVSSDGGAEDDGDSVGAIVEGPRQERLVNALASTKKAVTANIVTLGRATKAALVKSASSILTPKGDDDDDDDDDVDVDVDVEEMDRGDEEAPLDKVEIGEDMVDGGDESITSSHRHGKDVEDERARRCLWMIIMLSFVVMVLVVLSVVIHVYARG
jgi:hypothetical protein